MNVIGDTTEDIMEIISVSANASVSTSWNVSCVTSASSNANGNLDFVVLAMISLYIKMD